MKIGAVHISYKGIEMQPRHFLSALLLAASTSGVYAQGAIGSALAQCEKGVFVTAPNGAVGRIVSNVAGMCLVSFPNGAKGIIPGGSGIFPPAKLIRQAGPKEILTSGTTAGSYLCTIKKSQEQFHFALAKDGTYTLRESSGTYENSDKNSINFIGGELDGSNGWMNKGVIGFTPRGAASEVRCVVENR